MFPLVVGSKGIISEVCSRLECLCWSSVVTWGSSARKYEVMNKFRFSGGIETKLTRRIEENLHYDMAKMT